MWRTDLLKTENLFTFLDAQNLDLQKMAICHRKQEFSVLHGENGINYSNTRSQAAIMLALWALLNSRTTAHEPHGSKPLNNNAH